MPRVYIGTSGWTYDEWRDGLYAGVPRGRWLAHYAERFDAVEVNATFYHLLARKIFAGWDRRTPAQFRFAVKSNRYLTHVLRLDCARTDLLRERARARGLGNKLAAVLWQLPAALARDDALLERFMARLKAWPETRHAIEFRHSSWFRDDIAARLGRSRIALVQSDAADWPRWDAVTTDLVYVRLHGSRETYASAYGARSLGFWARRIRAWLADGRDVHVYFDNTASGHAVSDALTLRRLLERGGAPRTSIRSCAARHRRPDPLS